jgi:cell wall-associated NlpC family hydrolase
MKKESFLKFSVLVFAALVFSSCGSSRKSVVTTKTDDYKTTERADRVSPKKSEVGNTNLKAYKIVEVAQGYEGTRYKFGGTDKRGMDCSGLIYVSFLEEGIPLPRTSREMSLLGNRLFLEEVSIGDLLFFETNKNRKVINHVGLVVEVNNEGIYFIHSSSSRGVIISSLSEPYWSNNFVMARKVI